MLSKKELFQYALAQTFRLSSNFHRADPSHIAAEIRSCADFAEIAGSVLASLYPAAAPVVSAVPDIEHTALMAVDALAKAGLIGESSQSAPVEVSMSPAPTATVASSDSSQ